MPIPRSDQHIDLGSLEGPRSRWKEFRSVIRIARKFIFGFRKLHFTGSWVDLLGSVSDGLERLPRGLG